MPNDLLDESIKQSLQEAREYSATGLATFYNMIGAPRGITLPLHLVPIIYGLVDKRITNLMVIIGPGCLARDTIIGVERTKQSGLRKITIEELYHKFNGHPWYVKVDKPCGRMLSKFWDHTVSTRTLSWSEDRLAMNEIKEVVQSGIKEVYLLETEDGNFIRTSLDHPFLVPDNCSGADSEGYKKLEAFVSGDRIYVRNNDPYKFGNILLKEDIVKAVTYIGKEMTYDIVMNDPYRNFLANDFVVHNSGKSLLLTEIFPAWSLGHDPTLTILGVSAGEALIQGFLRSVMEIIKFSPAWKALFPMVRPDQESGWSTERGLFVTGRNIGDSDANYAAFGLDSKVLTGKHGRLLLFDDLHDKENSSSVEQCVKVKATYYNTLVGRADPQGARFIVSGRRWGNEDVYQSLMEGGDYVVITLPAERKGTNKLWVDVLVPDGLECCYTEGALANYLTNGPE